jgi:hypothetical protein
MAVLLGPDRTDKARRLADDDNGQCPHSALGYLNPMA